MGAPTEPDARPVPSAVLAVKIDMLIDEIRELRRGTVPRGEYEIARAADLARIGVLEAQQRQQGDRRWQLIAIVVSAAFAVVSSIITAAVVASNAAGA